MKAHIVRSISFALLIFMTSSASGGGLYIREFGHPGQGMSSTGAALAEDAGLAFQNPAGLFELESDTEWMANMMLILARAEFEPEAGTTIPGSDGGDAGGVLPGLSVFHTRKFSDKLGMTFAMKSISGAVLDFDNDFVGRYTGHEVDLLTLTAKPSLVYKVNENLSVSVGIPLMYGKLDLEAAIPPFIGVPTPARDGLVKIEDGEDFSVTISASVFWKVTDQFQLSLAYLGENDLEFSGDATITLPGILGGTTLGNIAIDVEIVFPQTLTLSTAIDISDQVTLTTSVGWEEWSAMDSIPVSTNAGGIAIPLNWDDVWSVGAGMRWKPQGPWTYYTGVNYDSDPTKAIDRISILPVDEQWRFSGGFTYTRPNGNKVGAVITYVDLGDARIDNTTGAGRYVGEFDTNRAFFLGLNYNWK